MKIFPVLDVELICFKNVGRWYLSSDADAELLIVNGRNSMCIGIQNLKLFYNPLFYTNHRPCGKVYLFGIVDDVEIWYDS